NTESPLLDNKTGLFCFALKGIKYKYYVECAVTNQHTGGREYYILLSNKKFDSNCRLCHIDNYGRCQIKVRGEMKEYIISETSWRGNIEVEYIESSDDYDVFAII
ncbi:hypothetical protein, partial [Thomasclavelia spiroformis]|uniref:hypothetical protein n=1 Tax=Thomasclavelia spiroformis TaxID=29348 RepID=UPI0024B0C573